MTNSVGDLIATISLDTAELRTGFARATTMLGQFSTSTTSSLHAIEGRFASFGKNLGALMTGFGALELIGAIQRMTQYGTAIANTAANLGMSTDALQEFRHALAEGGVESERADLLLDRFVKTIGEAAQGSDKAQAALQRVGISMSDLIHMSAADLWVKANDQLSKMSGAAQRNAAAFGLMGREAITAGNAVAVSAEQMAKLRAEADKNGGVVKAEDIEKAKQLNVEFDKMKVRLENGLLPVFTAIGNAVSWDIKQLQDFASYLGSAFDHSPEARAKQLTQEIGLLNSALQSQEDANNGSLMAKIFGSHEDADALKARLAAARAELTQITRDYYEAQRAASPKNKPEIDTHGAVDSVEEGAKAKALLESLRKETASANATMVSDTRARLAITLNEEEAAYDRRIQDVTRFNVAQLAELANSRQIDGEQRKILDAYTDWYGAKMQELNYKARTPTQKLLAEWRDTTTQMQTASAKWVASTADSITQMVMTGKADFGQLAESIVADIVKIIVEEGIANALGTFTGFSFGGAGAMGNDFNAGTAYMVGENGPEMFVPATRGTVISNKNLSSLGGQGGGSVAVNLNINTGVAPTVRAELHSMMPTIVANVTAGVADARARGGRYSTAFGNAK